MADKKTQKPGDTKTKPPVEKQEGKKNKELRKLEVQLADTNIRLETTITTGLIMKRNELEDAIAELKGNKGKK